MTTVLDEALALLGDAGPEFGGGLSNHAPMGAEALLRLNRAELVLTWVERYRKRLHDAPRPVGPIDRAEWPEALGDIRRAPDWVRFFERELTERPWPAVVRQWTPRFAPGLMAAATHGLIRTAHAVRALAELDTSERRGELAQGLGYWAARYQLLPGRPTRPAAAATAGAAGEMAAMPSQPSAHAAAAPRSAGDSAEPSVGMDCSHHEQAPLELPGAVLATVTRVNGPTTRHRGLIFEGVRGLDAHPEFAGVINRTTLESGLSGYLSDLTATFAAVMIANTRSPITFVHAVTAPAALRLLVPYLDPADAADAARFAWQACAALYAWFADESYTPWTPSDNAAAVDLADLTERAVSNGDEHVIKFTEACLREYAHTNNLVFPAAALHWLQRDRLW